MILMDHPCSTGNHCQVTLTFTPSHFLTFFFSPSRRLSPRNDTQGLGFFNRLLAAADVEFAVNVVQVFFYGFW